MTTEIKKTVSPLMVVLAFATVYLVWGSTYFFIQRAIESIPALMMGSIRFLIAGLILLGWCLFKKEKIWNPDQMKAAAVSGLLMLFVGNGAVIWAEQSLPSSLVAVLVSSSPIWFVVLDKPKWKENFKSKSVLTGLVIGFIGVFLLFSERVSAALGSSTQGAQVIGLIILVIGSMAWAGGSLYSKYKSSGSGTVSTAWQMLAAGVAFLPGSFLNKEWNGFDWNAVSTSAWLSLAYLITFGSLIGYSAYVWLLQVRPATQVSTYAYVNPVVAVLLGVLFAGEQMSWTQVIGLSVILVSVLLINLANYRKKEKPVPNSKAVFKPNPLIITAKNKEAV
jgi:drug/metabolite transporter (DMT)-like permease